MGTPLHDHIPKNITMEHGRSDRHHQLVAGPRNATRYSRLRTTNRMEQRKMSTRTVSIETRVLYALAFLAIGYSLGVCFPAVEKWPELGDQIMKAIDE